MCHQIEQLRRKGSWLNHKEIEYLNKPIIYNEIKSVIKNLPKPSKGPEGFTGKFYQTFEKELLPIFFKVSWKIEEEGILKNSFYVASITLIPKPNKKPIRKENYRPIFVKNLAAEVLNSELANWIQQHIKRIILHDQVDTRIVQYMQITLIQHINKMKNENHVILSIVT